ncbi:MAG: cytochrome C [Cytophagales bacterium]|nr:MAG: cytochrome C [Cytophagales bacterium]
MFANKRISSFLITLLFLAAPLAYTQAQEAKQDSVAQKVETKAGGATADLELGKQLYELKCSSCHALSDEVVVGPGLKGILERRTEAWLIPWIRNSQKVIASGDAYAVALYEKYNKAQMSSFEDLKDDEIKSVIAYIDDASKKVNTGGNGNANGGTDSTTVNDGEGGGGTSSGYINIILGVLVVVLLLMVVVLSLLMSVLTRYLKQREETGEMEESDKEVLNQRYDISKFFKHPAFIGLAVMLFAVVTTKSVIDTLATVGVQQGYAPTQPIAFSHKLHAGQYEIDCNYCHTGVSKGKSATIPAANVCMNCHNEIKRESPEIKKIYAAIQNDKPIEWIRVHNLPDFAYFNHAQHVVAGGLECQNCHGEVQEMEVVQQRATLTMGWCIDCHRRTVVKAEGNAYYDKLMAAHKQAGGKQLKVENIGGLECAKCHY